MVRYHSNQCRQKADNFHNNECETQEKVELNSILLKCSENVISLNFELSLLNGKVRSCREFAILLEFSLPSENHCNTCLGLRHSKVHTNAVPTESVQNYSYTFIKSFYK